MVETFLLNANILPLVKLLGMNKIEYNVETSLTHIFLETNHNMLWQCLAFSGGIWVNYTHVNVPIFYQSKLLCSMVD